MAKASACTRWEAWVQRQRTQRPPQRSQPQQRYPWRPAGPGLKNLDPVSPGVRQHPARRGRLSRWPALPATLAARNPGWGGPWVAPRLSGSWFHFTISLKYLSLLCTCMHDDFETNVHFVTRATKWIKSIVRICILRYFGFHRGQTKFNSLNLYFWWDLNSFYLKSILYSIQGNNPSIQDYFRHYHETRRYSVEFY